MSSLRFYHGFPPRTVPTDHWMTHGSVILLSFRALQDNLSMVGSLNITTISVEIARVAAFPKTLRGLSQLPILRVPPIATKKGILRFQAWTMSTRTTTSKERSRNWLRVWDDGACKKDKSSKFLQVKPSRVSDLSFGKVQSPRMALIDVGDWLLYYRVPRLILRCSRFLAADKAAAKCVIPRKCFWLS